MSEYVPIAVKRPWVPEWLFHIATHWLPAARLLCETPRCACGDPAEFYTDGVFECGVHYRAGLVRERTCYECGATYSSGFHVCYGRVEQ